MLESSRRYARLLPLVVFAMLLAACGGPAAPAAPAASSPQVIRETVEVQVTAPPQVVQATVEVPADAGTLVVYSGRSEALVAPLIAQFAEATGIKVDVRYGSTAEIAATLLEEGDRSPADVFFAQDPGGLGAVAEAGLFATLPDDLLAQSPERFRSPDGRWVGISGRARVVVYNTETLGAQDLPSDIWDFTDQNWSGRIGWAPSNGSLQAMITAMRVVWGEERTREWLLGIQANQPKVFEGNAQVVEAVAAGEVDVGFVNHYYLYRFLQEQGESFKARNHFLPGGGPGSLIMAAGAGRLAAGKNEANALRFIRFMLSPVAQQYFASQTYEYPVVDGVATTRGLPPLAELDSTALDIDMVALNDLQGTTQLM
ncbi:MAG TPA: iron ABC transporter substrate-binding protein, partial [Roseiflexaceae bacterium]|nr:iron ABC transporter substrate-binding protein [Roseiflexaceae bacterium]